MTAPTDDTTGTLTRTEAETSTELAARPGLTGDAWTALAQVIATLAENDSLVDDAIAAAERAGCPDATVLHLHEINDAMYRRRLRGSRPGLTEEQADAIALGCLQVREDLQRHAIKRAILRASRGETGPTPTWGQLALEEYRRAAEPDRPAGLTRAMHAAQQRPSVPARIEYEHGPDGETYRVEDDWQPCACGAAVSRGEAHSTGPGHDVDWSAVDRQRATLHAGNPAAPDPRVDYSDGMRPAVTGGECAKCLHAPPLHERTCPTLARRPR